MINFKIELAAPVHEIRHRTLYGDTDAGGVVYYANYQRYFEKGRTEFMREHAISYRELEDQGYILPVVESYLRYKAPACYDDLLLIRTSIQELSRISWRFNHHILRARDEKLLVKGFTVHVSVNRQGRITRMNRDILSQLKKTSDNLQP
ncbi:MAG: acyl-CoA thioesterase [Thermodesulfobacteriota bacterium]